MVFLGFLYCCTAVYADTKQSKNNNTENWSMCLCSKGANAVTSTTRKITLAQAKALVMATLEPGQLRLSGVSISSPPDGYPPDAMSSYQDDDNPRFLNFHVGWAATEGSDLVGWYSVDIYTGDVFDSVSGCDEYHNKKLAALQIKIRNFLHLTQAAYLKLKTAGPMCDPDE
jgi:hypothetical protein